MNRNDLVSRTLRLAAVALGCSILPSLSGCNPPALAILSPPDLSQADPSGDVPITIDLGAPLGDGGSVSARLLRGSDEAAAAIVPVALEVDGASATGALAAADLSLGRNTLFVSIDRDGDGRPDATVSSTVSYEPGIDESTLARCEFLDPSKCIFPFPSDHLTVEDPTTDSGRRVNFALDSMPARFDGLHTDPTEYNRNDGFSPGTKLLTTLPGVDLARSGAPLITKVARSLEADSPVVLIDAETGERRLVWSEPDPFVPDIVILRVGKNLEKGRRYVVALRNLRTGSDEPIAPGRAFRLYRDRVPTFMPEFESRRPEMERIFSDLARAGVGRDDLLLAWDFTIISKRNMSERMLAMRDDAFASLGGGAPEFTVTSNTPVTDGDGPGGSTRAFRRVQGTIRVPLYLTADGAPGTSLLQGPDGLPVRNPAQDWIADFRCTIPETVDAENPGRIVLYGHGLLGSESEVGARNIRDITTAHRFVYCATKWIGMGSDDRNNVLTILSNLSFFSTLPDRLHQGFLNFLFLGRAMKHPQGFVSNPAFQDTEGRPIIDTSDLFYDGNSQGGIAGGGLAAYAQDYTQVVLGVTGMNYSTLLLRSVDFDDFFLFLSFAYRDPSETSLNIALLQMLWDRVEANGNASHVTADPYPNTPAKNVLLHIAFGDHQVANVSAEVEARTMGARIHQPALAPGRHHDEQLPDDPTNQPYFGIDPLPPGPWPGSAIILWDSGTPTPPTAVIPPRPEDGFGRDPHETPRRDAKAQLQKSEFMKTGGAVVDVCGGAPCTAVDP